MFRGLKPVDSCNQHVHCTRKKVVLTSFAKDAFCIYHMNTRKSLGVCISEVFKAEIPLRSPRKLFIFIIYKNVFWIKVSKKIFYFILKKSSLVCMLVQGNYAGDTSATFKTPLITDFYGTPQGLICCLCLQPE